MMDKSVAENGLNSSFVILNSHLLKLENLYPIKLMPAQSKCDVPNIIDTDYLRPSNQLLIPGLASVC